MSEFETIKYGVTEGVATIALNRPEARNALNKQMREELLQAVKQADGDDQVRVVILAGEGAGFCAGADLSAKIPDQDGYVTEMLINEYVPPLTAISESRKPFIAAVNGAAAGFGASLVMACDLAVMADNAFLYCAFGAISLVPDGGFHWHLARRLGPKKTYEMILESQRLTAEECLDLRLTNKVVAADSLRSATQEWAEKLKQSAPLTARYSKEILRQVYDQSLMENMILEAELQNTCIRSMDFNEGTEAFFGKRAASFSGKIDGNLSDIEYTLFNRQR